MTGQTPPAAGGNTGARPLRTRTRAAGSRLFARPCPAPGTLTEGRRMTYLAILVVLTAVAAGGSRLVRMALRYGHLLALRGSNCAITLYGGDADGRYAGLPLVQRPAALRRFMCGVRATVRVRAREPRLDGR